MLKEESMGLLQPHNSFSSSVSSFVKVFTRYVVRRDIQRARELSFFFSWVSWYFVSLYSTITKFHSERRQLAHCVGTVNHKFLNNSDVASSFPFFFFSPLNLIDLLLVDIGPQTTSTRIIKKFFKT